MRYAWLLLAAGSWAAPMPSGKTHVNSIGIKLVRVEPGASTMGTDGAGGDFDEKSAHRVRITRAFYMGAFEVTNAQYEPFDPAHRKLRGKLGYSNRGDEAAVFVSGDDAVRFTRWLARREGLPYRLPTEAEWEYAARAGTAAPYYTGETLPAAFHKNPKLNCYPDPTRSRGEVPVDLATGKTPADPWGLHDMHGNVEEWCADWYGPHEPGEQADPVGRVSGDFRVTRGGSHSADLKYLRSANRSGALPEDRSYGDIANIRQGPHTLKRWFNTDGFERNASKGPASYRRRVFPTRVDGVRADMTNQWNGSLQREFRIRERVSLQLRCDTLNLQNRSQFAVPDSSPYSTSFGKIVQQTNATNRFVLVQARVRF